MNLVFKRWDKLEETDQPDVVIFFAKPDVLAGLFTLANFDQSEPNGTFTPFGSGCSSIIHHPYLETITQRQRAVIGMFDPRPASVCQRMRSPLRYLWRDSKKWWNIWMKVS